MELDAFIFPKFSPDAGRGTGTVTSSKLPALGMPTSRDFRRISRDFAPSLFSDGSFMVRTPLQSLV
jgi:hypothetical protein